MAGSSTTARRLKTLCTILLVTVGCVAFGAYVVVHWAERQVFNTDNWVALVSPLPKQPVVSDALGNYVSQQVFSAVPVQQKITDALPPAAGFLAAPLSSQLQSITTHTAQKLVASDAFQTIWTGANRVAMNRLLATARGQPTPLQARVNEKFNVDVGDISGKLRDALGSAGTAIPALQPAAHKAVAVTADLHARPRRVQQAVKTTDFLAAVLPLLVAASLLWALALSRHRRHTALIITVCIAVFMLLELIAVRWLKQEVLSQVHNSGNLGAVAYIYDTVVAWLRHMIYAVLGGLVILMGLLALSGPANRARQLRSYLHLERVKRSRVMAGWHTTRQWVQHWEYYLWLVVVIVVLVSLATFVTVNSRAVTNAALLTASLFALLHITATPPVVSAKRTT